MSENSLRVIQAMRLLHEHRHLIGTEPGQQSCSCGGWDWRQEGQPVSHAWHLAELINELMAEAWEMGAQNGSRGLLPRSARESRNPYLRDAERDLCACGWSEEEHDSAEHEPARPGACQACLVRNAKPNGLCDECQRRDQIDTLLVTGPDRDLLRYAAVDIRNESIREDGWKHAVAAWLEGLADRWSSDATGSEMDAAELVCRAYFKRWSAC